MRKLFIILSSVMALLSTGSWCTSYFNVAYYHKRSGTIVLLSRGAIEWLYQRSGSWQEKTTHRIHFSLAHPHTIEIGGFSGFGTYWKPKHIKYGLGWTQVSIPLWMPTSFSLATLCVQLTLPVYRRSRRRRHGLCLICAYDLATNTSGICPECGTPIPDEVKEQLTTDPPKR